MSSKWCDIDDTGPEATLESIIASHGFGTAVKILERHGYNVSTPKRYKCERDGCPEDDMDSDPYTLQGGYGSTILDCEPDLHFCSLQCLREWVNTGWAKDVTQ